MNDQDYFEISQVVKKDGTKMTGKEWVEEKIQSMINDNQDLPASIDVVKKLMYEAWFDGWAEGSYEH